MGATAMKTMATVPVRDREERVPVLAERLAQARRDVVDITEVAKALTWWIEKHDLRQDDPESDVIIALDECAFLVQCAAQDFVELSREADGQQAGLSTEQWLEHISKFKGDE